MPAINADQKDHGQNVETSNGNDNTQRPPGDWQSPAENPTTTPERDLPQESSPETPSNPEIEADEGAEWDGSDRDAADLGV